MEFETPEEALAAINTWVLRLGAALRCCPALRSGCVLARLCPPPLPNVLHGGCGWAAACKQRAACRARPPRPAARCRSLNGLELGGRTILVREDREDRDVKQASESDAELDWESTRAWQLVLHWECKHLQ